MKLLVLDFAKRWWWALLIAVLIAAGSTLAASPMLLGPIGAVLVFSDGSRGALRAMRPLPVSSRDQALACWFCGVPLVPILCLPIMIIAALLAPVLGASSQWFAVGVQMYVATGYAALCFLIAVVLPLRPPQTAREHAFAALTGATWGLSIPALTFLLPQLPRTPGQIATWHWVIFALAPMFLIASYTSASELLRRRAGRPAQTGHPAAPAPATTKHGLTGIPLFFTTVPLRTALLFLLMAAMQWGFLMYTRDRPFKLNSWMLAQPALIGIILSAMGTAWIGLRSFRILPISTITLTFLLLASPLLAALLSGLLATAAMRFSAPGQPMISPLAFSGVVGGMGALFLALVIRVRGGIMIAFVTAAVMAIAIMTLILGIVPAPFISVAAVLMGVAGALLLHRSLRRSSATYDSTRLPYMFGQQPQ